MEYLSRKQKNLISVVVPVYNSEKYLLKCINSLINRAVDDIEIIIVDDGSTDTTPLICDDLEKKNRNIKVIHQKNCGVAIARSNGVAVANGEYLSFVDSDDWVEPSFLFRMKSIIRQYSPDIICFGGYYVFGNSKKAFRISNYRKLYSKADIQKEIFPYVIENSKGDYFPNELALKIIKKELFVKFQVTTRIEMGEDGACVKPCIINATSMYVDNGLYYNYRRTNSSITLSGRSLPWKGPHLIVEHYKKHIDESKYDFSEQISRNFVHNLFNVAVTQYSSSRSYVETSRIIRQKLSSSTVQNMVINSNFTSIKGKICELSIRYKLCFIIYIRWLQKYRGNYQKGR